MSFSPLAKRLRLHTAGNALVLNAPEGHEQALGELPEGMGLDTEISGEYEFAHLFADNREQLEAHIDAMLASLQEEAVFWISYPKGSSGVDTDLNRDKLREALTAKGIRPVAQVSVDKVWSAMRFRPALSGND